MERAAGPTGILSGTPSQAPCADTQYRADALDQSDCAVTAASAPSDM